MTGRGARGAAVAASVVVAVALAGCGGSSTSGQTPRCEKPPAGIGPDADATLQDRDAGRTICLRTAKVLTVFLHAPIQEGRWGPIKATDGGVLEARSSGVLTLPLGVTAAVYRAAHPGTARLSSRRPPCGATTSACDAAHRWSARVVVR